MKVQIKLVGMFKIGRFSEQHLDFPVKTKVQDVVKALQLPRQHFGIVLINGEHAAGNSPLAEGDQLVIMPIVAGG